VSSFSPDDSSHYSVHAIPYSLLFSAWSQVRITTFSASRVYSTRCHKLRSFL